MNGPAVLACLVLTAVLVLVGVVLLARSLRREDATGDLLGLMRAVTRRSARAGSVPSSGEEQQVNGDVPVVVQRIYQDVLRRNRGEDEFHQAVSEVLEPLAEEQPLSDRLVRHSLGRPVAGPLSPGD